jgi:hypothetical protein
LALTDPRISTLYPPEKVFTVDEFLQNAYLTNPRTRQNLGLLGQSKELLAKDIPEANRILEQQGYRRVRFRRSDKDSAKFRWTGEGKDKYESPVINLASTNPGSFWHEIEHGLDGPPGRVTNMSAAIYKWLAKQTPQFRQQMGLYGLSGVLGYGTSELYDDPKMGLVAASLPLLAASPILRTEAVATLRGLARIYSFR